MIQTIINYCIINLKQVKLKIFDKTKNQYDTYNLNLFSKYEIQFIIK